MYSALNHKRYFCTLAKRFKRGFLPFPKVSYWLRPGVKLHRYKPFPKAFGRWAESGYYKARQKKDFQMYKKKFRVIRSAYAPTFAN